MEYGYFSSKLEVRPTPAKGDMGVFALQDLEEGELLCVWGGRAFSGAAFDALPPERKNHSLQVSEDVYLVTDEEREAVDFFNHSCEPNAGLLGQICLVAMRPIHAGEEVCFDYAMSDGSDYDEFECACGAPACRGVVRGSDWRIPALQRKYAGYFSPYLEARIRRLNAR